MELTPKRCLIDFCCQKMLIAVIPQAKPVKKTRQCYQKTVVSQQHNGTIKPTFTNDSNTNVKMEIGSVLIETGQ